MRLLQEITVEAKTSSLYFVYIVSISNSTHFKAELPVVHFVYVTFLAAKGALLSFLAENHMTISWKVFNQKCSLICQT